MDMITQLLYAMGNNPMPHAYPGEENITRDAYVKKLLAMMYQNFQGNPVTQPMPTPSPTMTPEMHGGAIIIKPVRQPNFGDLNSLFTPTPTPTQSVRR